MRTTLTLLAAAGIIGCATMRGDPIAHPAAAVPSIMQEPGSGEQRTAYQHAIEVQEQIAANTQRIADALSLLALDYHTWAAYSSAGYTEKRLSVEPERAFYMSRIVAEARWMIEGRKK